MPTAFSKRETKRFESKKGKSELSPADDQQARHFNLFRDYSTDGQEALLITSNSSVVKTTPFEKFKAELEKGSIILGFPANPSRLLCVVPPPAVT